MLNNPKVKYVRIIRRHFDLISPKDINTIYFIEEDNDTITLSLGDKSIMIHDIGDFLDNKLYETLINLLIDYTYSDEEIDGIISDLYINIVEDIFNETYSKVEIDDKDDNTLQEAKDYADSLEPDLSEIEQDIEDIKEDYVTKAALDLQLLEKQGIRPNGTDLLVIDGKINSVYIDSLYVTDIEVVDTVSDMLSLPNMKRGDIVIVTSNETTYILKQEPSSNINNWAEFLSKPEVISVNGKTGIVHIGISDIENLQNILNSKLAITTYENDKAVIEQDILDLENNKVDKTTYENDKGVIEDDLDELHDTVEGLEITLSQVYSNKNLAVPDLEGKEYLGNGWYELRHYTDGGADITATYNVYSGIINIDGVGRDTGGVNFITFPVNTNDTVTFKVNNINTSINFTLYANINGQNTYFSNLNISHTYNNVSEVAIRIEPGTIYNNEQYTIQIEKGDTATPYTVPIQPYLWHETKYLEDGLDALEASKQDKLTAGDNITIDPATNEISASGGGGGIDLDEIGYMNYASKIYYDSKKQNQFKNAWEHSLEVDASEIERTSDFITQYGRLQYPDGETEGVIIPDSVTSIGDYAFSSWHANNQPLVIPNSVTSIGEYAFGSWHANNQPLVIPNNVTSVSIGAFSSWHANNQPLVIPNSVTSISEDSFSGWHANNQPLVIPDSITSIGEYAFHGWQLVPYVEIKSITPPTLGNVNAFGNQNDAPIYVPDESVDDYKTATNWELLADRIFPISDMTGGGGTDFYRVRIFNEQDGLVATQIIYDGEKVMRPSTGGILYYYNTLDKFDYNDDVTEDIDLTQIIIIPPRYVQTTVEDFDSNGDYTGTEEYIILPADKTSGYTIVNPNVKGVATDGDYLTDASSMFEGHSGLYLELDYLDTSNVTNMNSMFLYSQATELDLSSFDTSNVTNMNRMFEGSQATELDLSSFDTSNINSVYMGSMFTSSQATTGYARTQADADKFNNSSFKPSTLTFVVK